MSGAEGEVSMDDDEIQERLASIDRKLSLIGDLLIILPAGLAGFVVYELAMALEGTIPSFKSAQTIAIAASVVIGAAIYYVLWRTMFPKQKPSN